MCYAQPGPRCFSHASEKFQKSQEKLTKLAAVSTEIQESAKKIAEEHPNNYKDRSDYKVLQKRYAENDSKVIKQKTVVRDDRVAMDATIGGIENIKNRLAELNPAVPEQKDEHYQLTLRSHFAEGNFQYKILAYDYANGTVNGRAPSGYGSDDGIKILLNRKRALQKHPVVEPGPKKDRYDAKLAALDNQIVHAKATKSHAQANITDWPSANLEENRAKLQKVYYAQVQNKERYDKAYKAYTEGPEKKKQEFLKQQKADGVPNRSQWGAWERGKFDALSAEAESVWEETVQPYSHRLRQLETMETKLRDEVMKGSITPKQRAELKSKSGHKTLLGKR